MVQQGEYGWLVPQILPSLLMCVNTAQGSAVIARQHIRKGQFVAQYAGEMLSNTEADMRLAQYDKASDEIGHALLVPICPDCCYRHAAYSQAWEIF